MEIEWSGDAARGRADDLSRENAKLRKINRVLMERVERSMDMGGNAFSLFETAIVLESRVHERTAALEQALRDLERSNRELRAAKAEAEAANRSKTHFLAAAGHDLLQPLNAARLFVSALAESRRRPADDRLIRNIDASFDAFEALLRDLLDISRLDAGVLTPEIADVSIDALFGGLAAEFAHLAREDGIDLRVVPSAAAVRSDPTLLSRILRNFLSNALRYTERGRVLLGCRLRAGRLSIEVHDTGPGIAREHQEAIFDEFRRFDGGRGRGRGYGLGLAIAKRAARVLDHEIEMSSSKGRGARFAVVAPLGRTPPVRPARERRAPPFGRGRRSACVVVVDNEPSAQAGMTALLSSWSCHVVAASTAEQAVAECAGRGLNPDLVIADYHLDDGRVGTSAITLIRDAYGATLPAMVVTADRSPTVLNAAGAGGLSVLTKPVRPAKLRSLIDHLLARSAAGLPG